MVKLGKSSAFVFADLCRFLSNAFRKIILGVRKKGQ